MPLVIPPQRHRRIYVASSWRNQYYTSVVEMLKGTDNTVYDFRNPRPGNNGFSWSDIDPNWQSWTVEQYEEALDDPRALVGFGYDLEALVNADACVLVLPCGKSAHLEFGYMLGRNRLGLIYMPERQEPELMYLLAGKGVIAQTLDEVRRWAEGSE